LRSPDPGLCSGPTCTIRIDGEKEIDMRIHAILLVLALGLGALASCASSGTCGGDCDGQACACDDAGACSCGGEVEGCPCQDDDDACGCGGDDCGCEDDDEGECCGTCGGDDEDDDDHDHDHDGETA